MLALASLENLDLLLGEALECIVEASDEARKIDILEQNQILMRLGRAVSELWEIREEIYVIKPELKRDFVQEYQKDEQRFEKLNDLQKKAYEAEKNSAIDEAKRFYKELLLTSRFGYFRLLAEAGLYRISNILTKK